MSLNAPPDNCVPLDFDRIDHLPKSQLDSIRALHESFGRALSYSLSLYLRSEVSADQIVVDQLSFEEFTRSLPASTCIAGLGITPFHGCALVEISPALLAPILDHVTGGDGKLSGSLDRELTELEKEILDGFFRMVATDLSGAWKPLVPVQFTVESLETSPPAKSILPNDRVVVASMELNVGESHGPLNFVVPTIALKSMRQYFDQQGAAVRDPACDTAQALRRFLERRLRLDIHCCLTGARVRLRDLLALERGQVLDLGVPIDSSVTAVLNGQPEFQGELQVLGSKLAMRVQS